MIVIFATLSVALLMMGSSACVRPLSFTAHPARHFFGCYQCQKKVGKLYVFIPCDEMSEVSDQMLAPNCRQCGKRWVEGKETRRTCHYYIYAKDGCYYDTWNDLKTAACYCSSDRCNGASGMLIQPTQQLCGIAAASVFLPVMIVVFGSIPNTRVSAFQ